MGSGNQNPIGKQPFDQLNSLCEANMDICGEEGMKSNQGQSLGNAKGFGTAMRVQRSSLNPLWKTLCHASRIGLTEALRNVRLLLLTRKTRKDKISYF